MLYHQYHPPLIQIVRFIIFLFVFFCFAENPVCFEESYRIEVLVLLRRLERLDQDVYAEDERQEAEEVCHYVVEE